MPKVHFVKKARRDYPDDGINKGESFYWFQFAFSPKTRMKTRPKPSQLTRSEFLSQFYALEEDYSDMSGMDSVESITDRLEELESELENLADEEESKRSNMPDHLQDTETGELIQNRADKCRELAEEVQSMIDDIEAIDMTGITRDTEHIAVDAALEIADTASLDWSCD